MWLIRKIVGRLLDWMPDDDGSTYDAFDQRNAWK